MTTGAGGRSPRVIDLDADLPLAPALVGAKAVGLARMVRLGLRVPPAFVLTTEAWRDVARGGRLDAALAGEVDAALARLETRTGRRLGDPAAPLLLAVRSGAAASMPGMMDTVVDVGVSSDVQAGLARQLGDAVARGCRDGLLRSYRRAAPESDPPVPDDARAQLDGAIRAVLASWDSDRARAYRDLHDLDDDAGTAVVVQAMVLGNRGPASGTGVATSRDPDTGRPGLRGDHLPRAQGPDVVGGERLTEPLEEWLARDPAAAAELERAVRAVEHDLRDAVEVEFTVEEGTVHLLQCRVARRSAGAAVRIAVDLADEGMISRAEAVGRVSAAQLAAAAQPTVDPAAPVAAVGTGACPGVVTGRVVLDPDRVDAVGTTSGSPVVLVRPETSPEDVAGMVAASGLLTSRGGLVSHAALVARELGLPAVVGVADLAFDPVGGRARLGAVELAEGDVVTIDGSTGTVHLGRVAVQEPAADAAAARLAAWRAAEPARG